jgi:hypothetical protein
MDEKPALQPGEALGPSRPRQVYAEQPKRNRVLVVAFALICNNLFSLFVGGIYEYLSLRGVVNVDASRYVLFFCWVFGSLGIVICVVMLVDEPKKKLWVIAPSVLVLGLFLGVVDVLVPRPEPSRPAAQPVGAAQIAAELFKLVPGLSPKAQSAPHEPASDTDKEPGKKQTDSEKVSDGAPASTSIGVHKPTETVVIPPNSSAVISAGPVSPADVSDLDRMGQETIQAGLRLSTNPDKLTLHDLFLTDFSSDGQNTSSNRSGFLIRDDDNGLVTHIEYRIVRELTLGTKVLMLYILPTSETAHLCVTLSYHYNVALGDFMEGRTEAIKVPGDSEQMTTQDSVASKRIFIYHETYISPEEVIASREAFKKQGLTAILRSSDYLENSKLQAKVRLLEKKRKAS